MNEFIAILIAIAIIFLLLVFCYRHMKFMASELLKQGLASTDTVERNAYLRKAALLFNREALLAYACNNPDLFVKPKLKPFNYHAGIHHFPCVFAGHYFAKGLIRYVSLEQKSFMKRIYAFDGLEEDCEDLIEEGIKKLPVSTEGVVIVFMPCSNDIRFKNKFQHLSWNLQKKGYEANHMTYPAHSVREKKDGSPDQNLMSHVGLISGLRNRKVIVVDDVLNTGKTLKAFAEVLKKHHAKIVGAVFVSKVFNPPNNVVLAWLIVAFQK